MLAPSTLDAIAAALAEATGYALTIHTANPLSGGDINAAYALQTSHGAFFAKCNSRDRYPEMFEAEADGLARMRATDTLPVPETVGLGDDGTTAFLLLELVRPGEPGAAFWEELGSGLARMHRQPQEQFGLERNNYIGSLPQTNTPRPDWTAFFIEQRLEPQCHMARDAGAIGPELLRAFDRAHHRLDGFFPEEPPALLHGDLWMGNFLCTSDGKPMLIDPAVYGGHREMDLAMTRLFGGFAPAFYQSYADTYPLENGWEERVPIANLYPLMVHVNLFGGHYVQQVAQCLRRFA